MSSQQTPSKSDYQQGQSIANRDDLDVAHDLLDYLNAYAREKPEVVALWCFGAGFVLGWKLKPW